MNPQEKAEHLIKTFGVYKALVCCEEIIKANPSTEVVHSGNDNRGDWSYSTWHPNTSYWREVKSEINKNQLKSS